MLRKTLRLPTRFSSVISSDPDILLPPLEPGNSVVQAETDPEIILPPEPSVDEHLANLVKQLARVTAEVRVAREQDASSATRVVVDLAIRAARHLVGKRIEAGEYDLEGMISKAIRKLAPQSAVVVSLHPEDLQLLQENTSLPATAADVSLQADASIGRGGFRVRTNDVTLWSDLETRLDEVRDALEQSLAGTDAGSDDSMIENACKDAA